MICNLTKQPTKYPVISKKTGFIFDRKAIVEHLGVDNSCPVTGKPMYADDILVLRSGEEFVYPNKKISENNQENANPVSNYDENDYKHYIELVVELKAFRDKNIEMMTKFEELAAIKELCDSTVHDYQKANSTVN